MSSHAFTLAVSRLLMRVRPAPLSAFLKKILCVRRFEFQAREGKFWVDPASYLGLRVIETGEYEPGMLTLLEKWLHPGDTFVDLGANEGYFSVAGSRRVGNTGRVLAVEPQGRLHEVLTRNFSLNQATNITLVQAAVSDSEGVAKLHLTPGVNNSASSLMQPTRYRLRSESVPTLTLGALLDAQGIATVNLLKIDIEGWEYEAVLGSKDLFRSGRVLAIALELHPRLLAGRHLRGEDITDFLQECGYQPHQEGEHTIYALPSAAARG